MNERKKVCEHGVTLGWHCGDCSAERLQRELAAANARAEKAEAERNALLADVDAIKRYATTENCDVCPAHLTQYCALGGCLENVLKALKALRTTIRRPTANAALTGGEAVPSNGVIGTEHPHPMLCFQHGGSEACEAVNRQHGFTCPKCFNAPAHTRVVASRGEEGCSAIQSKGD